MTHWVAVLCLSAALDRPFTIVEHTNDRRYPFSPSVAPGSTVHLMVPARVNRTCALRRDGKPVGTLVVPPDDRGFSSITAPTEPGRYELELTAAKASVTFVVEKTPSPKPRIAVGVAGGQVNGYRLFSTSGPLDAWPITNTGGADLTIKSVMLTGSSDFWLRPSPDCKGRLAPGASCTFQLMFAPSAIGTSTAAIVFESDADGAGRVELPLQGSVPSGFNGGKTDDARPGWYRSARGEDVLVFATHPDLEMLRRAGANAPFQRVEQPRGVRFFDEGWKLEWTRDGGAEPFRRLATSPGEADDPSVRPRGELFPQLECHGQPPYRSCTPRVVMLTVVRPGDGPAPVSLDADSGFWLNPGYGPQPCTADGKRGAECTLGLARTDENAKSVRLVIGDSRVGISAATTRPEVVTETPFVMGRGLAFSGWFQDPKSHEELMLFDCDGAECIPDVFYRAGPKKPVTKLTVQGAQCLNQDPPSLWVSFTKSPEKLYALSIDPSGGVRCKNPDGTVQRFQRAGAPAPAPEPNELGCVPKDLKGERFDLALAGRGSSQCHVELKSSGAAEISSCENTFAWVAGEFAYQPGACSWKREGQKLTIEVEVINPMDDSRGTMRFQITRAKHHPGKLLLTSSGNPVGGELPLDPIEGCHCEVVEPCE